MDLSKNTLFICGDIVNSPLPILSPPFSTLLCALKTDLMSNEQAVWLLSCLPSSSRIWAMEKWRGGEDPTSKRWEVRKGSSLYIYTPSFFLVGPGVSSASVPLWRATVPSGHPCLATLDCGNSSHPLFPQARIADSCLLRRQLTAALS